jgi:two-component system, NtrC family, response regulator HydG
MSERPAVLLIDDNVPLLENLREVLEDEGIEVDVARTGGEALTRIETRSYRLVITDMRMPGMDGLAVLRTVQERWPGLPVIVMTAYARDALLEQVQAEGALGVLAKPLDLHYLIDLVGRMVVADAPVLVVEDDADLRVNLTECILSTGTFVPHAAADIASARRLAKTVDFRAAIIDVRLPDGDGTQLGHELRARGDDALPIIYITGFGDQLRDTLRGMLGSERIHLLEKPFSPDELVALVQGEL